MSRFVELTEKEMYVVDGGGFWEVVEYAGGAVAAFEISKACAAVLGAAAVATAPAGAVTAVIVSCVGFAAAGTVLAGAAIIEATT